MDRPSLNLDILVHLMTFVDRKTLADLMLTSKMLNGEAAKERLRRGVQLFGPQAICSFLHFMCRAILCRLPYVKELDIAPGVDGLSLPLPLARQLAIFFFVLGVMPQYGRLRTLGVWSVEELLRSDESLALAIARIPTIKHLTLEGVGPHARRLLGCMQCQLLSADITIARPDDPSFFDNSLEPDPTNPSMYVFGRSQETLCELRITDSLSASHCARYQNMTVLSLKLLEMPRISDYVRAFPKLKSLVIDVQSSGFDQSEMDVQRALNRREQATQGSWPRLNRYDGYPCTLYHLGITCPITSVELKDGGHVFEPALLKAALEDACPRDLALSITRGDVSFKGEFLAALSKKAIQNLRKFDLTISLLPDQDDNNVYVQDMLNSVRSEILARLPSLTTFKLRFDAEFITLFPELEDEYPPLNVLEEQLAGWDMPAFASEAFKAAESGNLWEVVLSLTGHRARNDIRTTYLRDGGNR
ncbi:hypothetical protein FKP32DRAFT_1680516 [Trametes sanguinea]|nr:hypothetical protein FKP32DRAFT_1680516 [Trametes sanguinea]